jgi:hypothetical protein
VDANGVRTKKRAVDVAGLRKLQPVKRTVAAATARRGGEIEFMLFIA